MDVITGNTPVIFNLSIIHHAMKNKVSMPINELMIRTSIALWCDGFLAY